MSLDPKPQGRTKSTSSGPIKFNPLPKNATPDQIEMAYHQALIQDAQDVTERTKGVSFVKKGTAMMIEETNYADLQGLGTHSGDLKVKVRPLTEKERRGIPRRADATHVIETNIRSGVRWKRQLKILKDLLKNNNMIVIEDWAGTAIVRLGDADYTKKPTIEARYRETDMNKFSWVEKTTEADLRKLGVEILEKEKAGVKWWYLISVEDAQRVAQDGWGKTYDSVEELIRHQKIEANIGAEYGTDPLPYPEVIPEDQRESRIASHEKKRKERLRDHARWDKSKKEREKKEATKKKATEKRAASVKCPKCGGSMAPRSGRYGKFYGCTNYPNCTGTRKRRR